MYTLHLLNFVEFRLTAKVQGCGAKLLRGCSVTAMVQSCCEQVFGLFVGRLVLGSFLGKDSVGDPVCIPRRLSKAECRTR